jgi:pimeloyl-ACP methyl ester carboxylesterase
MPSERPAHTLALLPGMDGTCTLFEPFVAHLPAPFEAHPIALPPDQPLSYAELVEFVRVRLPVSKPFVLLAESFCTPLAIQIAAEPPAGLTALILVAGFATNPVWPWARRIAPLLLSAQRQARLPAFLIRRYLLGRGAPASLVNAVRTAIDSLSAEVFASRLNSIVNCDSRAELAQVKAPILYLQAGQDRVVPSRCLEEILTINPGITLIKLDGPHLLLQREPRKSSEAVQQFLEDLTCIRR